MAKSPEEAMASMVANLKENTGKTLEQWVSIARGTKLEKHGQIVKALKEDHSLGHGYANLVAHKLLGSDSVSIGDDDALIDGQYAGTKEPLRPIYDALIAVVKKFGKDVEISPKKAYVSLRRSKQFGLIQPSTATRVDVGINLKGTMPSARLEASGSFNAMVTHRVRLSDKKDVNTELIGWLKQAYDAA